MSQVPPAEQDGVVETRESTPPSKQDNPSIAPKLFPLPGWIRTGIMVLVALLVMLLLVWSGNMKVKAAEEAAYRRLGDAMAQAMVPQLLARNPQKTEQELSRIAAAGNFSEITLTDDKGNLFASTTKTAANVEALANAPATARVGGEPGNIRIERKIWLAEGNSIGSIRILVRR